MLSEMGAGKLNPCLEEYKKSWGDREFPERTEVPSLQHGCGVQIYTTYVVRESPHIEIKGRMSPNWCIHRNTQKKQFLKCSKATFLQPRKHRATIKKKITNLKLVWIIFASLKCHIEIMICSRKWFTMRENQPINKQKKQKKVASTPWTCKQTNRQTTTTKSEKTI